MSNPKRPPSQYQEPFQFTREHPETAASLVVKVLDPTRRGRVTSVRYVNPTGLAENATNAFSGTMRKGSDTFATIFNTDSDGAGTNTLAANAWVAGVIDADTTLSTFAAGDDVDLVLTLAGTQTLPPGAVVIEGYYF